MNGWDRSVLSRAVTTCTAGSGVIEDCPVFQNEGRFNADADMNACSARNPLPSEPIDYTVVPHLPGCIAVTEGPASATPADLDPGCVARRSEPEPEPELETEDVVECDDDVARARAAEPEEARVERPHRHRAMRGHGLFPLV